MKFLNPVRRGALMLAAGLAVFMFGCGDGDSGGDSGTNAGGGGGSDSGFVSCTKVSTPCPNASTTPVNAEGIGSVTCGDETYKTVKIDEQIWMAENLNYNTGCSKCYDNDQAKCIQYGRLYTRETALNVCPNGWHLPNDEEWQILMDFAGGSSTAGTKLKATNGWTSLFSGTDDYGFSALPSGDGYWAFLPDYPDGFFLVEGLLGVWWSSTEGNSSSYPSHPYWSVMADASFRRFSDGGNNISLLSVRCVQD